MDIERVTCAHVSSSRHNTCSGIWFAHHMRAAGILPYSAWRLIFWACAECPLGAAPLPQRAARAVFMAHPARVVLNIKALRGRWGRLNRPSALRALFLCASRTLEAAVPLHCAVFCKVWKHLETIFKKVFSHVFVFLFQFLFFLFHFLLLHQPSISDHFKQKHHLSRDVLLAAC